MARTPAMSAANEITLASAGTSLAKIATVVDGVVTLTPNEAWKRERGSTKGCWSWLGRRTG
jgi:hypothetical protein